MPRANRDLDTAPVRYPRTLFFPARLGATDGYPPPIGGGLSTEAYGMLPDNWNGLSLLRIIFLGGFTEVLNDVNITINIGTCDEVYTTHTQTVNGNTVNLVINEYECFNLTVIFAVVLANLTSSDLIWVTMTSGTENNQYVMGIELQES